eukprot:COSAG02_NODE_2405_length_8933_cov_133.975209_2_plen_162_part_00
MLEIYRINVPAMQTALNAGVIHGLPSLHVVVECYKTVKHTVTINVSEDYPVLAELLKSITTNPGFPKYVLFQYSWRQRKHFGQPLSDPSTFNARLKEAIQFGGLCADLAKKSAGCNAARHADVAANRKRPALTQQQVAAAQGRRRFVPPLQEAEADAPAVV